MRMHTAFLSWPTSCKLAAFIFYPVVHLAKEPEKPFFPFRKIGDVKPSGRGKNFEYDPAADQKRLRTK
jgi:hypothetical protein